MWKKRQTRAGSANVMAGQTVALGARMLQKAARVDSRTASCIWVNARRVLSACVLLAADGYRFQAAATCVMIVQSSA